MTIQTGDSVPNATLLQMGEDGPEQVVLAEKLTDRKVVSSRLQCQTCVSSSRALADVKSFSKSEVLYICVDFWLLLHESHDLSKAEMKINVVTS